MEPFIGEIRMMGFNYAPEGWAFCDGQRMSVSQNNALFALLGDQYGGDGRSYFNLPDLRGRAPMQQGAGMGLTPRRIGETGGLETVTLMQSEMPSHRHGLTASGDGAGTADPTGAAPAVAAANVYGPAQNLVPMADTAVVPAGGDEGHANLSPFLALNFCIALQGIWPSRW